MSFFPVTLVLFSSKEVGVLAYCIEAPGTRVVLNEVFGRSADGACARVRHVVTEV